MEKGSFASLYRKETETGFTGVCGSWSPATFGMWTFTQVRVLSPRQLFDNHIFTTLEITFRSLTEKGRSSKFQMYVV